MILNTGSRTDIPAYYGKWFYNRVREGYVLVRNPYFPAQVTKYLLRPEVVDVMVFCTKNPEPMMNNDEFKNLISTFDTFWFVTITPYGKDIEPFVPPKEQAIQSFQTLSALVGKQRISWRYDPVFITDKYSVKEHIKQFRAMAGALADDTSQCVVSFIDLYEKTKKISAAYAVSLLKNRNSSSRHLQKSQENSVCRFICAAKMCVLYSQTLMRTGACQRPYWKMR